MRWLMLCVMLMFLFLPMVFAVDFDEELSDEDRETFDGILEPVMRIYNFVKYAATVLAVIFLLFASVTFILSGGDQAKKSLQK